MNKLRKLRKDCNITLRDLRDYTQIPNGNLSLIENERRPFRQKHIDILSAFFDVTSDYLLGRSDTGIIVYTQNGEPFTLNEKEFDELKGKIEITVVDREISDLKLVFDSNNQFKEIVSRYMVYREFRPSLSELELTPILTNKLSELAKRMSSRDLEKTIKFIEDYVLDK